MSSNLRINTAATNADGPPSSPIRDGWTGRALSNQPQDEETSTTSRGPPRDRGNTWSMGTNTTRSADTESWLDFLMTSPPTMVAIDDTDDAEAAAVAVPPVDGPGLGGRRRHFSDMRGTRGAAAAAAFSTAASSSTAAWTPSRADCGRLTMGGRPSRQVGHSLTV